MQKAKNRFTYYHTLLARIISTVLATLLVLSASLYFSFQKFTLDYIHKSDLDILRQISSNVMQINRYSSSYATSLFTNPSTQRLMYSESNEIADLIQDYGNLYNLVSSAPFVRSFEIYNGRTDKIYHIGKDVSLTRTKNDTFDPEFPVLIQRYTNNLLDPLPRVIFLSPFTANTADVLTYIITETSGLNSGTRNAIALNVNTSWIFNAVYTEQNESDFGDIYLLDKSGLVKASTNESYFMKDLSSEPFFRKLQKQSDTSGYLTIGRGEQKMLLSYRKLQNPDWIIVKQVPYRYIADSVIKVRSLTLVISVLTVLLGVLISLIFSRKLYIPVHSLMKKSITLFSPGTETGGERDEFEQITRSITSASEEIKSLKHFESKSIHVLQQDFLRSFLLTPYKNSAKLEEKMYKLNLAMNLQAPFVLILYKIDHYSRFRETVSEYEQIVLKFGFTNIAKEIISQKYACEIVDMGDDRLAAIIQPGESAEAVEEAELKALSEKIHSVIYEYFKFGFSAFVGAPCSGQKISETYRELGRLSGFRLVYGQRCTLFQRELEEKSYDTLDPASLNLQVLLDALKLCNPDKAKSSYESIETHLYRFRCDDILMAVTYLSSMMFNTLLVIEKNGSFDLHESYADFNDILSRAETLEEIKQEFYGLFDRVTEKISSSRNHKAVQIIQRATEHIQQNYLTANISANTIATLLGLTPEYLNKIFRESESVSVSEYITRLKIDKACQLLTELQMSVDEVIRKIGWENKNYFYTVFKKTTGVTPSEYRSKTRKDAFLE